MATIGETLRAAREARGLSIEDVRNTTQIKAMQIEEMENDDYSWFSAPVYAKGFLRLFARAVNLDPTTIVRRFETEVGSTGNKATGSASGADAEPVAQTAGPATHDLFSLSETASDVAKAVPPPPSPSPSPDAATTTVPAPDAAVAPATGTSPVAPTTTIHPAAAATDPATDRAPAHRAEKRVASTTLDFERRSPPPPLPEKRVAPPKPGEQTPTETEAPRPVPRQDIQHPEAMRKPVVKLAPVPQSALSPDARPSNSPIAPDPLPQDGPLFVFPSPVKSAEGAHGDGQPDAPDGSPEATATAAGPCLLVRKLAAFREWNSKRKAVAAARAAGMPIFETKARRAEAPAPALDDESPFADPVSPGESPTRISIPKALTRRHAYAAAAIIALLAAAGVLSRLSGDGEMDPGGEEAVEPDSFEQPDMRPQDAAPSAAPAEEAVAAPAAGETPPPSLPDPEDPVPVLPPPPSFAK